MSSYILDTDIVGFVQQGHPTVLQHLHALSSVDKDFRRIPDLVIEDWTV